MLGRPLLALYAQRLYPIPPGVRQSATFRRAFLITSAAWLAGHSLRAVVRLWLLNNLPLELYLIADTVAGWPINISLATLTAWYPLRELGRAGVMSVAPRELTALDAGEVGAEPRKADIRLEGGAATRVEIALQLDAALAPALAIGVLRDAARSRGASALAEAVSDALRSDGLPLARPYVETETDRRILDLE